MAAGSCRSSMIVRAPDWECVSFVHLHKILYHRTVNEVLRSNKSVRSCRVRSACAGNAK